MISRKTKIDAIEQQITEDLIISIYKKIPGSISMGVLIIALVAAVMWSPENQEVLIAWLLLMIAGGIVFPDYNARAFLKQLTSPPLQRIWKIRLLISPLIAGSLWATALFTFYDHASVEQQMFLVTVILILIIGGILGGMYYLPKYYVYVVPIFCALIIRFLQEGTFSRITLAIFMSLSFIFVIWFSRMINNTMRSELRLRYESDALAEELQKKTKEAERAVEAKTQFLAAASHDLRQPLHSLSLFHEALKSSNTDEERASLFPRMDLSLDALIRLFDSLLDLSQLDAKAIQTNITHFEVHELLEQLLDDYKTDAIKKNITIRSHSKPIIIKSDRLLLERVLRNLISNAIRYTKSGGVLLSARIQGANVLVQVWDTGVGIAKKDQQDLFVEFKQLHNAHRDRAQGLGLGLSLVQRLCLLLQHPLSFRTQLGRGTVFNIEIPEGDVNLIAHQEMITSLQNWDFSGYCVLVIDDEAVNLDAIKTLLNKWNCDVITAKSLSEAIIAIKSENRTPDLILSDLRLRDEVTGIEVINNLREKFGLSIPGILLTGDTAPERIRAAKESAYDVLQKPAKPAQLRLILQHYFTLRKL